jgi:SOS-response transcriptional repressor LexA
MMGLTRLQADCLRFVGDELKERGIAPTRAEICAALGVPSKSQAQRLLEALEQRGRIVMLRNRPRATSVVKGVADIDARAEQHRAMIRALAAKAPPFLSCIPLHGFRLTHSAHRARAMGDSAAAHRSALSGGSGGTDSGAHR